MATSSDIKYNLQGLSPYLDCAYDKLSKALHPENKLCVNLTSTGEIYGLAFVQAKISW
jgi:hypothetical protein